MRARDLVAGAAASILITAVASLTTTTSATAAPTVFETQKVIPDGGRRFQQFGQSVAMSGDVAVFGAPGAVLNGPRSGAIYIFRRTDATWNQEEKLYQPLGGENYEFGIDVDTDGTTVIAGAFGTRGPGHHVGSAHIYRYDGSNWNPEASIQALDKAKADRFGSSVAILGDVAVVGSPHDDDNGDDCGAVYVFRHDGAGTWNQEAKIVPADAVAGDRFGIDVAIENDVIAIGSMANDNGRDSGAVYIYRATGPVWNQEAKLFAADPDANDLLGKSIALSGDVLVAGASGADTATADSVGLAYVWRYSGGVWNAEKRLTQDDEGPIRLFGSDVATDGNGILVAAKGADTGRGRVHYFEFDGADPDKWIERAIYKGSESDPNDMLGISVAIDGANALAGAYWDSDEFSQSGSAYSFRTDNIPSFAMTGPTPGTCNANNTFNVTGATPDGTVTFVYGFQAGNTQIPTCPGLRVDIRSARILTTVSADANGEVDLTIFVSSAANGVAVIMQAVDESVCDKTNTIMHTFTCQ